MELVYSYFFFIKMKLIGFNGYATNKWCIKCVGFRYRYYNKVDENDLYEVLRQPTTFLRPKVKIWILQCHFRWRGKFFSLNMYPWNLDNMDKLYSAWIKSIAVKELCKLCIQYKTDLCSAAPAKSFFFYFRFHSMAFSR